MPVSFRLLICINLLPWSMPFLLLTKSHGSFLIEVVIFLSKWIRIMHMHVVKLRIRFLALLHPGLDLLFWTFLDSSRTLLILIFVNAHRWRCSNADINWTTSIFLVNTWFLLRLHTLPNPQETILADHQAIASIVAHPWSLLAIQCFVLLCLVATREEERKRKGGTRKMKCHLCRNVA